MTKKDYIVFAAMLRSTRVSMPVLGGATAAARKAWAEVAAQHALWCRFVQSTADVFERDNPRFNRNRFLIACGLVNHG